MAKPTSVAKKKPAAKKPAKKAATKQPAAKKPAAKKPAAKKPAVKKPAAKKPAAQSATKQPATTQSAAKQPAAKQPAAKQPAAKQPAAKQPATRQPATKQAAPHATSAGTVPTVGQVTKWFSSLLKTGSYETNYDVQAFFYDPIYSNDAAVEVVFETWATSVSMVPIQLVESELCEAKNWTELHRFFTLLTPEQLASVVPKIEAFVTSPKRPSTGSRFREIEE